MNPIDITIYFCLILHLCPLDGDGGCRGSISLNAGLLREGCGGRPEAGSGPGLRAPRGRTRGSCASTGSRQTVHGDGGCIGAVRTRAEAAGARTV
jgi:hypothetical protein